MKSHKTRTGVSTLCPLIVEDNEHMRLLLRTLLKAMDIRNIVECSDGAEALAELPIVKPDFILTDFSMAPMDGLTFTRAIRQSDNKSDCVVPIIMVTGHTERRRVEAARDAGVTEILVKPVTPSGLFQRIEEIILRPRPFVRSPNYCGPCRRRRANPDYLGPWRRKGDNESSHEIVVGETGKARQSS